MEDSAVGRVPDADLRRYKRHCCMALAHFDASPTEVREAILGAAKSLVGFSPALTAFDDRADLEVDFHTPKGWLDVLSFHLQPVSSGQQESTGIVCFSRSSNLCPDVAPWAACRFCCNFMRLFSDGGQNRKHVVTFFEELESRLKKSAFLEIVYSS